jgi:hypothetical protein
VYYPQNKNGILFYFINNAIFLMIDMPIVGAKKSIFWDVGEAFGKSV